MKLTNTQLQQLKTDMETGKCVGECIELNNLDINVWQAIKQLKDKFGESEISPLLSGTFEENKVYMFKRNLKNLLTDNKLASKKTKFKKDIKDLIDTL